MNSTCIQYEGSRLEYIQVQELENMHKTPYRTRINTNICIHLTPPSNSRWINHIEFGEIKTMLLTSPCLCEEISQLKLGRHIAKSNLIILNLLQVQNHTLQRRRGQVRQEVNQRWRGDVDFVLSSRARFRDRGANSSVLLDPPCDVAHQQLRYLIRRAPLS